MVTHDSESQHPAAIFVGTNVSGEYSASVFSVQDKSRRLLCCDRNHALSHPKGRTETEIDEYKGNPKSTILRNENIIYLDNQ
jgi:hypothetical protein